MKAVILAGGKGTRLKTVVPHLPKPMASVGGRPFLEYIFEKLILDKVDTVVLSVGYKREVIKSKYNSGFKNLKVSFSEETTPLLTGGAIKKATEAISDDIVIVLNGDSYTEFDLKKFYSNHLQKKADVSILAVKMTDASRYGLLQLGSDYRVTNFCEKQPNSSGYINAGIYLFNPELLRKCKETVFSFEEWLKSNIHSLKIYAYPNSEKFIDIGVPEDYELAQSFF